MVSRAELFRFLAIYLFLGAAIYFVVSFIAFCFINYHYDGKYDLGVVTNEYTLLAIFVAPWLENLIAALIVLGTNAVGQTLPRLLNTLRKNKRRYSFLNVGVPSFILALGLIYLVVLMTHSLPPGFFTGALFIIMSFIMFKGKPLRISLLSFLGSCIVHLQYNFLSLLIGRQYFEAVQQMFIS